MNINLLKALVKSDFGFDQESYQALRGTCYELLRSHAPQVLALDEAGVADFVAHAGHLLEESLKCPDARFDDAVYHRALEILVNSSEEERKKVYMRVLHDTFEQKMVMFFVAVLGLYVAHSDCEDDFWEPYGLSGHFLLMDEGFAHVFEAYCLRPLYDDTLPHYDRRLAAALSGVYSLAVTLMGLEAFNQHLHKFLHYVPEREECSSCEFLKKQISPL